MPDLRHRSAAAAPDPALAGDAPILFDAAHLERQTAGDKALQADLLTLFLDQVEAILPRIAAGAADRMALCHRLTGAARAIGAWRFAAAAERVEAGETAALLAEALTAVRPVLRERIG